MKSSNSRRTSAAAAAVQERPAPRASNAITDSRVGPWGQMQLVPIVLELPDEHAMVSDAVGVRVRWTFAGRDRAGALTVLESCGLTAAQLDLARAAEWNEGSGASSFVPSDELILSLSPAARSALYSILMRDVANKSAVDPTWFRVGRVDFRLRGSGLRATSTAMLKRLLYVGAEGTLLFSDLRPALRAITDPAEQLRFLKAVTRKRSLMARLIVQADTDTHALAAYWGRGGREKALLPLIESMKFNAISGVENPGLINIASLLPTFVQERLYRHANAAQPAGRTPDDCFWTAFNFFNDEPDDRVHDMSYLAELLRREYVRVEAPSQLGDVVVIADAVGDALHAANYIADQVVFTKNGMSGRQPWMLTTMKDMLSQYGMKNAALTLSYFRKR